MKHQFAMKTAGRMPPNLQKGNDFSSEFAAVEDEGIFDISEDGVAGKTEKEESKSKEYFFEFCALDRPDC